MNDSANLNLPRSIRIGTKAAIVMALTGFAIFFLWSITRRDLMMTAGVALLCFAVPVTMGLLIWIGISFFRNLQENRKNQRRKRAFLAAALLLVLNFPLALFCILGVIRLMSEVHIQINNQSGLSLGRIIILEPDRRELELGSLENEKSLSTSFYPHGEGSVRLRVESNSQSAEENIIGYISGNFSADATVVIGPNLQIQTDVISKPGGRPIQK